MNENEAILRRGLRVPSVILEERDSGRHGARQVRGGLQALAVDQLPLQVPDGDVARRRGDVVAREGVAAHGSDYRQRRKTASIQFHNDPDTV